MYVNSLDTFIFFLAVLWRSTEVGVLLRYFKTQGHMALGVYVEDCFGCWVAVGMFRKRVRDGELALISTVGAFTITKTMVRLPSTA